jgi:hypothetical protein
MGNERRIGRRAAIRSMFFGAVGVSQSSETVFAQNTDADTEMMRLTAEQTPEPAPGFKTRLIIVAGCDKYAGGHAEVAINKIGPSQINLTTTQTLAEGVETIPQVILPDREINPDNI